MKILTIVLVLLVGAMRTHCLRPCETCLVEPIGPDMGALCRIAPCPCSNVCTKVCTDVCANTCQCAQPQCGCIREIACPCNVCSNPSPCVSSCLDICGCDCDLLKSVFHFPEVEYPATVLDVKPPYCGTCWTC